ncbi:MAG: pitrilysin family protein [Planctomycetota bacterium]|nr:pitrilysin family protein [Planctomycetota bacterium]
MKTAFFRRAALVTAAACLTLASAVPAATPGSGLPARPEDINFKPLSFTPPKAAQYRRTLSSGVPVYLIPSKEFPLVNITLGFRPAGHLEDKTGLAAMTNAMIRRGGTTSISAQELDESFDFLGAQASSTNLNALKSNLDEAMRLFFDMVRNPGFQEDKVRIYKDELVEQMKQRNDDPDSILALTGQRLLWGDKHFEGRVATQADIEGITIDDLRRFHARVYHPGNLIIGVTGDFEEAEMLSRLDAALSGWNKGEPVPDPTDTDYTPTPGLYYVEKDTPQGKIWIAQRGLKRDHPDIIAVEVLNDILGGGGFTSRLMKRIRSDEGLTYGVGSAFQNRVYYPGLFRVNTFSKNRTVALTTKMVMEEIEKIRSSPVSQEELDVAKKGFIETFPRRFESKAGTVNTFIDDEWTRRPADWWDTYRDRMNSVTVSDVQRVAQEHLSPDKLIMLVVGKWSEIKDGDPTEQRDSHKASMLQFFGGAEPRKLPLLDPLTQQPLPEEQAKD